MSVASAAGVSATSVRPCAGTSSSDVEPRPRDRQHVPDRNAHTAPVQRIGGLLVEQHRVDPERGGVPEEATEVLVIRHPLDDCDRPRAGQHGADRRQCPPIARCDRAAMQIETDNRAQDLGPGDVDGRVGAVEHAGHRVVLRRGDQHRTHPPVRSQQCLDDMR